MKDRRGCEVVNVLSRLDDAKMEEIEFGIDDTFSDEEVLAGTLDLIPWLFDYANFLVSDALIFTSRKEV